MNATEAIDKIVKLLGLKFKKEKFFTTKLIDGDTEVTNNLESEFGIGQTLYVVGDSTLTPAPVGTHTTREGLVLTVDEESTITKIEENVQEAQQEVVEDQVEVEQSAQSFVEAKDAQGNTLESDTFDVGEEVYVVGPDGEKTPAPNGEHQVVLKDTEGNEVKIRIQTVDGKIVQRENVEGLAKKKTKMESYPWDECISDQMENYGDEEIAKRVCGAIKAGNFMEMPGSPDDLEFKKELLVSKVLGAEFNNELESIKSGINQLLEVVDSMNGKFKTDINSIKTDFESFKNSPQRKPIEKKAQFKETFEDFRIDVLKGLRKN
jgi:hypothetical protein